jgi:hypothetical protein
MVGLGGVGVVSLRSHWLSLVIRFSPSLASLGDHPLTASISPLAVDLRPRVFVSEFVFELSGFSIVTSTQGVYRLSFYPFQILLLPSIGTTATFSLRFDSEYLVLHST